MLKMQKGIPAEVSGFVVHFWINKADMMRYNLGDIHHDDE